VLEIEERDADDTSVQADLLRLLLRTEVKKGIRPA